MHKQHHTARLVGAIIPVLLLAGCSASGPGEKEFMANAEQQLKARDKTICLPIQGLADYSSVNGSLPTSWSVLLDNPQDSGVRGNLQAKFNALVELGIAQKEPYQLHKNGTLVSGARYFLTAEGRKAMSTTELGGCLQLGQWKAKALVQPRSGIQGQSAEGALIHKKEDGPNPSYEAYVSFELADKPTWANSKLLAAFPELTQITTGKTVKVELVQFNKAWVSKQVLAQKMAKESAMGGDTATKVAAEIPADLQAAALSKMTASTLASFGASGPSIRLPVQEGSETPRELTRAQPGAVFLANTPDAKFREQELNEARKLEMANREKSLAMMPPEMRATALAGLQREREFEAARAKFGAQGENTQLQDRFLNSRQELAALLDALVEVGAYEKRAVKSGDVAGVSRDGVLYTPSQGTKIQNGVLRVGSLKYTRILKQDPIGAILALSVAYEVTDQPQWLAPLLQKHPELGLALSGVRQVIARPIDNPELPYDFMGR